MYDRFMFEGREYMVSAVTPKRVSGKAVKWADGGKQTVTAKIDDCEWL